MTTEQRFRKDCIHFRGDSGPFWLWLLTSNGIEYAKCFATATRDLVSGKANLSYCSTERLDSRSCGPDGRRFGPRRKPREIAPAAEAPTMDESDVATGLYRIPGAEDIAIAAPPSDVETEALPPPAPEPDEPVAAPPACHEEPSPPLASPLPTRRRGRIPDNHERLDKENRVLAAIRHFDRASVRAAYADIAKNASVPLGSVGGLIEGQSIGRMGSYRWNTRTLLSRGSRECYRILGLGPNVNPVPFQAFRNRVQPDDLPALEQALAEAVSTQSPFRHAYRVVHEDGATFHVIAVGQFEVGPSGDLELDGIFTEVTEQKAAEQALTDARAELARTARLGSVGELAGSIVHEVNQPLTGHIASAEACIRWLARDRADLDKACNSALRVIEQGPGEQGHQRPQNPGARRDAPVRRDPDQ